LLDFARNIYPQFCVWKQIEPGHKRLLIEFTDCLHTATFPGNDIDGIFNGRTDDCLIWRRCKEILEAEILLYRPKVLIGNGTRYPSEMLRQILANRSRGHRPTGSMFSSIGFGCNFHFSDFITRQKTNSTEWERLVREIRQSLPFEK
jgi:hypothetical protein